MTREELREKAIEKLKSIVVAAAHREAVDKE